MPAFFAPSHHGKGFFVVDPVVIRKSGIFTLCQIIDFSYSRPTPKRAHYCHLVCNITKEGGYGVLVKNALLSIIRNRGRGDFYMANRDPGADPRSARGDCGEKPDGIHDMFS